LFLKRADYCTSVKEEAKKKIMSPWMNADEHGFEIDGDQRRQRLRVVSLI
jgi:hypothetical protein